MKNLFLTAALLLTAMAGAQSDATTFGIKGGVQFTNFTGDGEWTGNTGYYVGGLVDLPISGNFHLQPELLVSKEGATGDTEDNEVDFSITYLRIPVMLKYYVIQGLSLQAGPQIAFKVGTAEDGVDDVVKSSDIGLGVGAGYDLPIGLMFDIRYNLGLTSISEGDGDLKNSGIMLGLGYRF